MPRKNPVKKAKSKSELRLETRIRSYEETIKTPKGSKGFRKPGSQQIKW